MYCSRRDGTEAEYWSVEDIFVIGRTGLDATKLTMSCISDTLPNNTSMHCALNLTIGRIDSYTHFAYFRQLRPMKPDATDDKAG